MWQHPNLLARSRASYDAWLERFYFTPSAPAALALCRIWLFAFVIYTALRYDLRPWANVPEELWRPILLLSWVPPALRTLDVLSAARLALLAAAGASLLGLATRYSTRLSLGLAIFVFGFPQCFGKVNHGLTIVMFALGIFAVSRCGDALSLDAALRKLRGPRPPGPSGDYRWPIALMQALMMTAFFASAVAKLRNSGLDWVASDHLLNTLLRNFYTGHNPPTGLGQWLAQFPLLCHVAAGLSLWNEFSAPLALYNRRYRWWVVPNLLAMQIGIYLTMGVSFEGFWVCYLFWIDWNWVAERTVALAGPRAPIASKAPTRQPECSGYRRAA
jgi:hypothetical protein